MKHHLLVDKVPLDDEKVKDNFDSGFNDDLEATFQVGFVGVVLVLLTEYGGMQPHKLS